MKRKYYRCKFKQGVSFTYDHIYPESYAPLNTASVSIHVKTYPVNWQEVQPCEYWAQEGRLPEKWFIKRNRHNKKIINDWGGPYYWDCVVFCNGVVSDLDIGMIKKEYIEISFQDFKDYVLDEVGFIKHNTMKKKIIGYRCPMDMFESKVKKGDIFSRNGFMDDILDYHPLKINPKRRTFLLPKEIVETWEPVYEKPGPDIIVNGHKAEFYDTHIQFGCAEIDKEIFIKTYDLILQAWCGNRHITAIKIGEGLFNVDQIRQIAEYYKNK